MNRKHIHQFDSPKNPSKTKTKILNLNEMKNSFKSLPSSWKNNPPESISKILSFYEYKEQNKQYHIEKQLEELQTIERLSHETANLSQEYYYQHKLLLYYNKNIKYNAMKQLYKYSQLNRKTSISFKRATRVYLKKLLDSWKVQLQQNRLQDKIYMISKLYLYRRLLLNSIIEIKTRAFNHKYIKQKLLSCLHEKYHSKLSEVLATLRLVKKRKAFMRKLTSSHTKIVVLEYFHNLKQHRKSLKAIRRITESFYLKMYYAFLYCMKVNKMKKQNTFRDNRKLMRKSFMRFILQVYKKKRFRLLQSKLLHKASRNPLRVLKLIAFRNLYQFIECKRSNMQDNEYYTRKHLNYQILKSLSQWKQYTNTLSYNRQEMKLPSMNFWLRFKKSIIAKRFRNCFQLNIFIQAKQHYNLFLSRKYINRFYSWLERLFKHHPLVPNTSRYKSLISYRSNKSLYLLTRLKSWYYYSLHNTIRNKRSNTFKAYKYWRLKRLRYSLKRFQDWMRLLQDVNITIDNSHCYPIYSIILNRIIPYSYSRKRRVIKGLHNHVNKFRSITLINQSNKFHCKYQLKKSIGLWKVYITKVMNHKQVLKESNQVYHYRLLKLSLRHWNEFINLKYHPRRVNCHDILLTSQLRRIQYIIVIWIQRQLHLKTFNNWYDIALQYYLHKRLSLTIHKLRRYLTSKRRFTTSIQSGILLYNNLHQSNVMKVMKQKKIQYQRIDYNSNIALAHQLFKLVHLIKECFHIWKRKFSKCLNILKLSIRSHNITLKKRFFNTMVLYMKSKQRQDSLIQFAYISRYEYQIGRVIDMLKIFVINKTKDKDIVCKHHYDIVHLMNRNRPERRYIHHLHDITQLKKLYYIKYIDMIKKNIYQTILSHSMISIGSFAFRPFEPLTLYSKIAKKKNIRLERPLLVSHYQLETNILVFHLFHLAKIMLKSWIHKYRISHNRRCFISKYQLNRYWEMIKLSYKSHKIYNKYNFILYKRFFRYWRLYYILNIKDKYFYKKQLKLSLKKLYSLISRRKALYWKIQSLQLQIQLNKKVLMIQKLQQYCLCQWNLNEKIRLSELKYQEKLYLQGLNRLQSCLKYKDNRVYHKNDLISYNSSELESVISLTIQ